MVAAVVAAAATIGAEYVGAVVMGSAFELTAGLMAKAAFSAGLSLISESLQETPSQTQSPITSEIQARKQLIRTSAAPRRALYGEVGRVSGNLLYVANGADPAYVHFVIALAGHRCQAINAAYLGDELVGDLDGDGNVTTGRFAGFVRIRKYLGTADQVMDALLAAECPEWGAKNRPGKGITYVYLRIKRSRDVFPQGIPTPRFDVLGKADILDVRTSTTGYSNNAALCTLDYVLWKHGFKSDLDEVVQATWIAAANTCDEDVALPAAAGGGTQKRYAINGSFTLDRGRAEVLDQMRQAMAGAVNYTMGQWYGHAGAADTPVMDISERDLRGGYRIRPRVPDDKVYNAVKGTFTETAFDTETDFPPVTNPVYEAQDGGQRLYKDVKLPFENNAYRAQRLCKIDLERHRQGIVVELPMRIRGLKLRPWNIVRLSLSAPGFSNKWFRVIGWKFNLFGGADLVLEEYADAIYTWSSLEATTVDPAPDTTLPNPFVVAAPPVPVLSSGTDEIVVAGDGTLVSRIKVTLAAPADPFVRWIHLRYKKSAATDWTTANPVPANAGATWLGPVEDAVAYDVAARYESGIGPLSAWTQAPAHVVIGETENPATPATVATTPERCFFSKVADRDVKGYEIRAIPGAVATWSLGVAVHDGLVTDSPYRYQQRLTGLQTIMVAAVDRGDRVGLPNYATLDFGAIDDYNIAQSYDYRAAGFPGTITDASLSAGDLVADTDLAADYWGIGADDWWTHDGATGMWGGSNYLALQYVDVFAAAYGGGDLILDATLAGSRATLDWRADGATAGDFWAPGGADFWAGTDFYGVSPAWQPYIGAIGSTAHQGVQFRVSIDGSPIRGQITALSARLQMPDKEQVFYNVAIDAGGTRLAPAAGTPAVEWIRIEEANFTVFADGSGATSGRVVDFDPATGPLVQTLNAAGAAVSSTGQSVRVSGY